MATDTDHNSSSSSTITNLIDRSWHQRSVAHGHISHQQSDLQSIGIKKRTAIAAAAATAAITAAQDQK